MFKKAAFAWFCQIFTQALTLLLVLYPKTVTLLLTSSILTGIFVFDQSWAVDMFHFVTETVPQKHHFSMFFSRNVSPLHSGNPTFPNLLENYRVLG